MQQNVEQLCQTITENFEKLARPSGTFVNCPARFGGEYHENFESFIYQILSYKEAAYVNDEAAFAGLAMLLEGRAAMWWQGAKPHSSTWTDAVKELKEAFGERLTSNRLLCQINSTKQGNERTVVLVRHIQAMLAKMDFSINPETQLEMIYGLLNWRIKERVPRDSIGSIDELLKLARSAEDAIEDARTEIPLEIEERSFNEISASSSQSINVTPNIQPQFEELKLDAKQFFNIRAQPSNLTPNVKRSRPRGRKETPRNSEAKFKEKFSNLDQSKE